MSDFPESLLDLPLSEAVMQGRRAIADGRESALDDVVFTQCDRATVSEALSDYRLIEEPDQAEAGSFLRWVRRADGKLFAGGHLCKATQDSAGHTTLYSET